MMAKKILITSVGYYSATVLMKLLKSLATPDSAKAPPHPAASQFFIEASCHFI
ncbi:MAG: hypothetical protein LW825_03240 [Candidatus Jidaibacter sp.]|jgi:hypothetical protein|nr:hypothetical protein [Candidatus Jidaibacter sp.]